VFVKAKWEYEGIVGVFDQHSNRSGAVVRMESWANLLHQQSQVPTTTTQEGSSHFGGEE
jgi:hypothetical protein